MGCRKYLDPSQPQIQPAKGEFSGITADVTGLIKFQPDFNQIKPSACRPPIGGAEPPVGE